MCAERCSRSIDRCTGGSAIRRSSSGRSCSDRSFRDRAQYESYVPGSYRGRTVYVYHLGSVRSVLLPPLTKHTARVKDTFDHGLFVRRGGVRPRRDSRWTFPEPKIGTRLTEYFLEFFLYSNRSNMEF